MAGKYAWGTHKWLLFLALIGMIFMRLVWLQIRTYQPVFALNGFLAIEHVNDYFPACTLSESLKTLILKESHHEPVLHQMSIQAPVSSYRFLSWLYGSWGCRRGELSESKIIQFNKTALVVCVFLSALLARTLTSSWVVAAVVAAVLLSRGRFLAEVATIGELWPIMVLVMAWGTMLAHFLRSASPYSLGLTYLMILMACLLHPSFLMLTALLPLVLLVGFALRLYLIKPLLLKMRREQGVKRVIEGRDAKNLIRPQLLESSLAYRLRDLLGFRLHDPETNLGDGGLRYQRGGMLRPLHVPFVLWVYHQHRWLKLMTVCLGLGLAMSWVAVSLNEGEWSPIVVFLHLLQRMQSPTAERSIRDWFAHWSAVIDVDLIVSIGMMFVALKPFKSRGLRNYWAFNSSLLLGALLVSAGTLMISLYQPSPIFLNALPERNTVLWFEPLFLTGGVLVILHLLQIIDQKLTDSVR